MPDNPEIPEETAIVITVPDANGVQVLVRVPGHVEAADIMVDFRPDQRGVWSPSEHFPRSVEVRHQ